MESVFILAKMHPITNKRFVSIVWWHFMDFKLIAKDIVEAFLYIFIAKELWDEHQERFRQSIGPLLY